LRIIFANRASEDMLGIEPQTVVGSLIGEYFPASVEGTDFAAAYHAVATTQTARDFGVISYGEEGAHDYRFALSAYPLSPDLVVIFFDNLSASPARRSELGAIVDSATDAVISKDLEGTILSWNRSAERIYGYSADEAIGRPVSILLPPDRPNEVVAIIDRLRAGERVDQFETTRVRKDGVMIDVSLTISPITDLRGAVVGVATIARDITGLKESTTQMQRLAAIVAASDDAITSRGPDGVILSWNAAAERLFGYSAEEMIGRSDDLMQPEDRLNMQEIRQRLHRGERQQSYETKARAKDGSEVLISVSSSPIRDGDGELVGVASVMRDITEQRRLEDHLRQSQKMEAIGSLAGGVAHDFNNVLTVIRTASEAVLAELDEGALRDKVRQIDLAAEHATTLTRQLLAFSRQQVLDPEPIDLNAVVTATCEMAARLVGEQVQIDLQLGAALPAVEMDRGQFQQVILNLSVNARDAMPDGGVLRIRTAAVQIDETYVAAHLEVPPGHYVLLELTDSGVGMDEQTRDRVFDPFFTTKPEGTGLGLATVYGIVKQSGGQIFVYSEPGIGTTFRIYLPPYLAAVPRARVAPSENGMHRGGETILLVEDGDLLRPMITDILESRGYTVVSAADGVEALALFADHDGTIDLLLTDVVMPRMNGRELAERLSAMNPAMRVLFTSGYPDDGAMHQLIADGDVAFIQKPYGGNELVAKIRASLAASS
jgi:PAS domain S-box-containing protein